MEQERMAAGPMGSHFVMGTLAGNQADNLSHRSIKLQLTVKTRFRRNPTVHHILLTMIDQRPKKISQFLLSTGFSKTTTVLKH